MTTSSEKNLHEALAEIGIQSVKDHRSGFDGRSLYRDGVFLGSFRANEAWQAIDNGDLRTDVAA